MRKPMNLKDGSCFPVGLVVFGPGKSRGEVRMASTDLDGLIWPPARRPAGSAFYAALARRVGNWRKVMDRETTKLGNKPGCSTSGAAVFVRVGFLRSGRRRYVVKGALLARRGRSAGRRETPNDVYLLAIERPAPERVNLPQVSREWKLSRREKMLVYYLSQDMTNKEIARELRLSPNTVKVYMKNLMKKLSVRTRAAILPTLLFTRRPMALGPRPHKPRRSIPRLPQGR